MNSSMMAGGAVGQDGANVSGPPLLVILTLLLHSTALGVILCTVTYTLGRLLHRAEMSRRKGLRKGIVRYREKQRQNRVRTLIASSNLLFLCVGLTGTMILVNNTMVRAFAIAAAIALVRFKVNLNGRDSNSALLFGILSGIACGLQELKLAWVLISMHAALSTLVALGPRLITILVPRVKAVVRPIAPSAVASLTDLGAAAMSTTSLSTAAMPAAEKKAKKKTMLAGTVVSVNVGESVNGAVAGPLKLLADTARELSSACIPAAPASGPKD
jgi:hypothetical protein